MDPAFVTRVIIVTAVTAAVMKIFGAKGFLITLALLAILLFLIYKNQNKILYMPGNYLTIQIFRIYLVLPKTIPSATGTLPKTV